MLKGLFGKKSSEENLEQVLGQVDSEGGEGEKKPLVSKPVLIVVGAGGALALLIVAYGLMSGGTSSAPPITRPPAVQKAQAVIDQPTQPKQAVPAPPALSAVQPAVQAEPPVRESELPKASSEDRDRDVFVEFYINKLRERSSMARRELERSIREDIKEAPPVPTVPVSLPPAPSEPLFANEPEKEIKVENVVCGPSGCVAYTNLGKLMVGDRISDSEKVVKITPNKIETSRRTIRW